jgi:lactoylglutathione lyase
MAKLDHIGIYVSDIEKSLIFYEEIFGFKQVNSFSSGEVNITTINIVGSLLELIHRKGSPGKPPDGNWSHIAIHEPKFDEIIKKINLKKIEKRLVTMANGNRLCFFSDPDGHTIEIMESGFQ